MNEIELQRKYYTETAQNYENMHSADVEHEFAMNWLMSCIRIYNFQSLLDIGAGTGSLIRTLTYQFPTLECLGVEPVEALREKGYENGINRHQLIDGDAYHLQLPDNSFDIVTEFAVLHHVKYPEQVVSEMLRVARKAIFISDSNNYGQGSFSQRIIKNSLRLSRLWRSFNLLRTQGKGYHISEGDGIFYSYSVFNNYKLINNICPKVYILNTTSLQGSISPIFSAPSIALLALKT